MSNPWEDLEKLSDEKRRALFDVTVRQIRQDTIELGRRLEEVGWIFHFDGVIRPDELREHDVDAIEDAEELLGHELPGFVKAFALEVGAIFLAGHAEEGSELARHVPDLTDDVGVAEYAPLTTIPLPGGINELEMCIDEGFEDLGVPIIEDALSAAGMSGGPPLCLVFDVENPESTTLHIDLDSEAPYDIDLVGYIRTCLRQGGFFLVDDTEARQFLTGLSAGLGEF